MKWCCTLLAALLGCSVLALAQDAKPQADDKKDITITLELRANEAFNRGQYSLAREQFLKVVERIKDDKSQEKRLNAIQEQIRVCDKNIKDLLSAMPVAPADQNGPQIETAADKRKKHQAPKAGEALSIHIKELGNFEFDADKGGNIPEDVKNLTGSKIQVRGFMIPLDQADNISHFALVPSLFACCFGQPPQIQHQIVVNTPKGKAVSYFPDEIVCEGTLKVGEKKDDGYIVSVFEMEVSSVKPAAK